MPNDIKVLELTTGQMVKDEIEKFFKDTGWKEAYVMAGLGSLVDVEVTNADGLDLPPAVKKTPIKGPFEALSFFGEVILQDDGDVFVHIHSSGSLTNSETFGGGLATAKVFRGFKIYMTQVR